MALSGREVLLVLRARDEATRTIHRVSGAMRRMDRDASTSSTQMIKAQRQTLWGLQKQLGDVNYAYSQTSAQALERHRAEMRGTTAQLATLSAQEDQIRRTAATQAAASGQMLRDGKISEEAHQRAAEARQQLMHSQLRDLHNERRTIEGVRRTSRARYQEEIEGARRLHIAQKENIRQQRVNAQESIRMHEERLRMMDEERARIRNRGMEMQAWGAGMVAAGVGMTYFGIRGMRAWYNNIEAAIDYEQQARRTLTQVDKNSVALERVSDMGKRVADTVPVAFEEVQPALYDIFSSIDVGVKGAEKLLKQFAEDAVAGTTEMSVATRANLAIMNAWKLEVGDAADVSDFMFQLVRKGVGSYDEFAKSIGRAIPAARRAGQSYHTLGGMMAFLTRNGLSTAMAATSSARALEAIAHPETVKRLEKLNIKVRNAKGEFLPLVDILDGMNKEFGDMTSPQRSKALQELFRGSGGTIQARRFFDNYFKNSEEFVQRTKEMQDATGEAGKAFKTMADSPGARLQALKNDWMLLRIEMGEHLIPVAMQLIDYIEKAIGWWRSLDEDTRKHIVTVAAVGTAIFALLGILTIVGGALLIFKGSMDMLGVSATKAAGKMGIFGAGVAILAKGIYDARTATNGADQDFGAFQSAAGGALMGFAVGGPWGAAIGGGIGLLLGLTNQTDLAAKEQDELNAAAKRVTETLNAQTGAFTKRTKEQLVADMGDKGMLNTAVDLGLELPKMTEAVMSGYEAVEKFMNNAMKKVPADNAKARTSLVDLGNSMYDLTAALHGGQRGWMLERLAMGKTGAMIQVTRERVEKLSKRYDTLPRNIRTIVKVLKADDSRESVQKLAEKYDLLPKTVRTIFKQMGAEKIQKETEEVKGKLEDVSKTKPNLNPWKQFFSGAMRQTQDIAQRGVEQTNRSLKTETGKARADMMPFRTDLLAQIGAIQEPARTKSRSLGEAVKSGTMQGVSGLVGLLSNEVAAAVREAIRAGRAAAKAKSPSREMMDLGKDMSDGLTIGLRTNASKDSGGNQRHMSKIVKQLMRAILKEWKNGTFKMADVISEAKPLIEKKLDKMAKGLKGDALRAFNRTRKRRAKGLLDDVVDATEKNVKRLQKLGERYEKVMKRLQKAREKLQNLRDEQKAYIQSVKESIKSYGSFSSFSTPQDVFGNEQAVTSGYIQQQLAQRLAVIKEYGDNLKKLLQMGYSKAVYDMVVQLGPEAGNEYAKALLAATPEEMSSINQMVGDIQSQAGAIAQAAGSEMYDAGIAAAEGLVKGLEDKADDLRKIAKKLGRLIARTIKKELGIKSPSKVALSIGHNFGGALASGLRDQAKDVSRASKILAKATELDLTDPRSTYTSPVVSERMRGGFAGPVQQPSNGDNKIIKQEITVNTQEIDPRAHAQKLGWELASYHRI